MATSAPLRSIYEIRLSNLTELIDSRFGGSRSAFASVVGMAPNYVHRFYVRGANAKRIGDNLAREIEAAAGLPVNWMDNSHQHSASPAAPELIPVRLAVASESGGYVATQESAPVRIDPPSAGAYGLRVFSSENDPSWKRESVFVVDPEKPAGNGSVCVVRHSGGGASFSLLLFLYASTDFYYFHSLAPRAGEVSLPASEVVSMDPVVMVLPP